jgi:hypothetical protein
VNSVTCGSQVRIARHVTAGNQPEHAAVEEVVVLKVGAGVLMAIVCTVALSACNGGSAPTRSGGAPERPGPGPAAIRGFRLNAFACDAHRLPGKSVSTGVNTVTGLIVCPAPRLAHTRTTTTTITASAAADSGLFAALSARDQPMTTGPCTAVGELPIRMIAKTAAGPLLVHIPAGVCGQYQNPALRALARATTSP